MDGEEVKVSIHDMNDELVVSSQGQIADMNGGSGWEEFDFSGKGEILVEKGGRYTVKVSNISLLNRVPLPEHQVLYWQYSGDEYANGYAVMDGLHKYSNDFFFVVTGHDCVETCEWAGHECGVHLICDQWVSCGTCGENETCTDVQGSSICQLNETDTGAENPPVGEEAPDEEGFAVDAPVLDELKQNGEVVELVEGDESVEIEDEDYLTLFGTASEGSSVVVEFGEYVYLATADENGEWSIDILGGDVSDGTYEVSGYSKVEGVKSEVVVFFTMQKGGLVTSDTETEDQTIAVVSEDDGSNTVAIMLILAGAAGVLTALFFIIKRRKKKLTPEEVVQEAVKDIAEGEIVQGKGLETDSDLENEEE